MHERAALRSERSLRELIAEIVGVHHARLREQLRAAEELLASAGRPVRGAPAATLLDKIRRFRREQEGHLAREERVLFPLIEELEEARRAGRPPAPRSFGPLRAPIELMQEDHALGDRYLARLRQRALGGGTVGLAEQLGAIEEDLRVHVALEDEILFVRAIALDEA